MDRVAIIGAGMAGLTAAHSLDERGVAVEVFEKARGPGGRMSRRREGDLHFDHGAQYFTARDPRFESAVESWRADGIVAEWDLRLGVARAGTVAAKSANEPRFVGVPGMNAVCRRLAEGLPVRFDTRIERLVRDGERWKIRTKAGEVAGSFDAVLVTAPPAQSAALLAPAPDLARRVAAVRMAPCLAVMAAFVQPLELPFDGLFVHDSPLSWAARNAAKPGRPAVEAWVLHASPEWSEAHFDEDVTEPLVAAFFEATGHPPAPPTFVVAHQWRHAIAASPLETGALWEPRARLGAGGDWCHGSRVEGAFLSGLALAELAAGD